MTTVDDPFLEDYLTKYDRWIADGKVSHVARIIPIDASLDAKPWVMPSEQVMGILREAQSVAVWPCVCRTHYKRCDKPVDVCLVLNKPAESLVAKSLARMIDLDEAARLMRLTDEHGLVHMGLFMPDYGLCAVCSCCSCCCHELQIVQQLGRLDRLARSEYTAVTDMDTCDHCGACIDPCAFGARKILEGALAFQADACLGCGLCVPVCPSQAITMLPRTGFDV
jgi:ferredoxin-like protein FixX